MISKQNKAKQPIYLRSAHSINVCIYVFVLKLCIY